MTRLVVLLISGSTLASGSGNLRRLEVYPSACPKTCTEAMRFNRFCDEECDNFACALDNGECVHTEDITEKLYGECPTDCPLSYINDDWCDTTCNSEECGFDGGDCSADCAEGCHKDWLGDYFCDDVCDNKACNYDEGDCTNDDALLADTADCPSSCSLAWINDGLCDQECNIKECNFDGDDCDPDKVDQDTCAEGCASAWIGDGECDPECAVASCQTDGGDCARFGEDLGNLLTCGHAECSIKWLGDGVCDDECDTKACKYDMGDCPTAIDCTTWGSAGVGEGKECIFPFKYQGVRYDECTNVDSPTAAWCSIEVDDQGNTVKGQWGNCEPDCATTCMTIGTAGVGGSRKCSFPFMYAGKRYDFCTSEDSETEWCATKTGFNGSYIKGQWGECSPACHVRKLQIQGPVETDNSLLGLVVSTLGIVAAVLLCVVARMWCRIRRYETLEEKQGLKDPQQEWKDSTAPKAEPYGSPNQA